MNQLSTADVTLIGVIISLVIGIMNLLFSSHKNHTDLITTNRMKWVTSVRKTAVKIISWRYNESTAVLLNLINRLILYLNISNKIDNDISTKLLKMYDAAYELSLLDYDLVSERGKSLYEEYYSNKQEFNILIRIYLKKEWTRIKVESRLFKIPFVNYWIPFFGFCEKWATESLRKKYDGIETYKYEPWIEIDGSILASNIIQNTKATPNDRSVISPDGKMVSTETFDNGDSAEIAEENRKKALVEALKEHKKVVVAPDGELSIGDDIDSSDKLTIVVPSGKLA